MAHWPPAAHPTLHFIGVSTSQSAILRVFPLWARALGLPDARIAGMDLPVGAEKARYRDAVAFIKSDRHSRGALITTHKLDVFAACRDLFDETGPAATQLGETSCLSKRGGRLLADAVDPFTSGLALDAMLPSGYFARGGHVFTLGAGGAALAITWHLLQSADRPVRIVVCDRAQARLDNMRAIHRQLGVGLPVSYVLVGAAVDSDQLLAELPGGSLVVNASGLGKDGPGSPLSDAAQFPPGGVVWELNYRGARVFLEQARRQQAARALQIHDGWLYFLHGWLQVISRVFEIDIAGSGAQFSHLAALAAEAVGR